MKPTSYTYANPDIAARAAGAAVSDIFQTYNNPVLFLSSGGSALKLLDHVVDIGIDSRITLGVLDERYSRDPAALNFVSFTATAFFKHSQTMGCGVIDTSVGREESHEQYSFRLDGALKAWKTKNPSGVIVVTMGIGNDGHTAGIIPYPEDPKRFDELFINTDTWMLGYDAGRKSQYNLRTTVTVWFLKSINHTVVYICGSEKKDALGRTLAPGGNIATTPARVLWEMKNVQIFTDIALT